MFTKVWHLRQFNTKTGLLLRTPVLVFNSHVHCIVVLLLGPICYYVQLFVNQKMVLIALLQWYCHVWM